VSLRIKKAVITAAGQNQRALPLQTVIDRDGREKSVLGILIEQALTANVEQICVVVWPGDESRYATAVGSQAVRQIIEEYQPLLSLHGHIHESRGITTIGRTTCINPGSDYARGQIHGAVVKLSDNNVTMRQLVIG